MKRRTFLVSSTSLALAPMFRSNDSFARGAESSPPARPTVAVMDESDELFLREIQRRCYRYFVDTADPRTGFIPDRAAVDGTWVSAHSSSAACGFGLAAHSIAARAQCASLDAAHSRVLRLLRSIATLAEHERGFLYHYFDVATGRRSAHSEVSSIDMAILVAGMLTAASTFSDDAEIITLAEAIYARVQWTWMLGANDLLHMGWMPETGMIPHQWDRFSELTLLVLLAIGAPESAIPSRCWNAWQRSPILNFQGESFVSYPPLFVHQFPLAFFDLRNFQSSEDLDYWANAVLAHQAQIAFLSELGKRYPDQLGHYGNDLWGLSSSDSETGYRDWGGPYADGRFEPDRGIDGTIVPSASAGGLVFVPQQAMHTLRFQFNHFGDRIFSRFGFVNAFNPRTNWVNRDAIGIDTGITLLMAENLLGGSVWDSFMNHSAAQRSLQLAGFARV